MEFDYSCSLAHILTTLASIGIIFLFFWFVMKRKATDVAGKKPRKLKSFAVNRDKEKVLKTLISQIESKGYSLEDSSEHAADLLISDEMEATSWGFYYSIYLTPTDKHVTLIEVGIKSKVFQIGPVVTKHHLKCIEKLQSILI